MRSSTRPSSAAILPALFLAVASAACGSGPEAAGSSEGAAGPLAASGAIGLRADVPRLDGATWDDLVVAHDGPELWLRPEARSVVSLAPGAVTVIPRRGVLKVASVTEEGGHLVVERVAPSFGDFIENGELTVSGRAVFDTPFVDTGSDVGVVTPKSVETDVYGKAGERALVDGAREMILDGWNVTKHVRAVSEDSLRYDIGLDKTSGIFDANVRLRGSVDGVRTSLHVAVKDRVTQTQTYDVKVSGDAEMSWAVRVHQGGMGYNKILAPGLSYKTQVWIGEIPIVVRIRSSVAVILGASGAKTVTTGKVSLTYASDAGLGASGETGASTGGGSGEASFSKEQGTVATAPAAFGFVATLPRIEVGVGIDGLFVAGASFTNIANTVVQAKGAIGGSICADAETRLSGTVGVVLEVNDPLAKALQTAGMALAGNLASKKIYEKTRDDVTCGFAQ